LAALNEQHGTNFALNFNDAGLYMGKYFGEGFAFDLAARKVAIFHISGRLHNPSGEADVVDFSYFRKWKLTHDVTHHHNGRGPTYSNVFMVFETSDLNRPIIKVYLPNLNNGEWWDARLAIMFNAA
jgi:hypothetical protein